MTPTAELLIRTFQSEAAHWDDVTTTDADVITRNRAEARRDQLDWAIAQLKVALPAIEDEAVGGVDADIVTLETQLGWRAA